MKQRKNDILWKVLLKQVFDDLLRFIYPDADEVYDLQRGFTFLDKELAQLAHEPEEQAGTRLADKLVKIYTKNGEEEWVLLHIEIQGDTSRKKEFSERMFRYFYRIFDKYNKPISAVAIFTGKEAGTMPVRFQYAYRKTRLLYEYHTISIQDYKDEELARSKNPFGLVLLTAKTAILKGKFSDIDLLEKKVLIANTLNGKTFPKQKMLAIFAFLKNYIVFKNPEMNRIFMERVEPIKNNIMGIIEWMKIEMYEDGKEEGKAEGIAEGIEEGRNAERNRTVAAMLKNTKFSVAEIAKILMIPEELVLRIKKGTAA